LDVDDVLPDISSRIRLRKAQEDSSNDRSISETMVHFIDLAGIIFRALTNVNFKMLSESLSGLLAIEPLLSDSNLKEDTPLL
jgi:hypothetical protein